MIMKIVSIIITPYKPYRKDEWNVKIILLNEVNACAISNGNAFVNIGFF